MGLALASGLSLEEAVPLANVPAGLEVERFGVVPVTREDLRGELVRNKPMLKNKILSLDCLSQEVRRHRQEGKSIVLTNGCFDLLHFGHVTCLQEASLLGDILIVAINSDSSVRRLKGAGRPIIPEDQRAGLIAALSFVDYAVIFESETPLELIRRLRPEVVVKGGTTSHIVGCEVVEQYGGRVHVTSTVPEISTTQDFATNYSVTRRPRWLLTQLLYAFQALFYKGITMPQTALPVSDITPGGWLPKPIYQQINNPQNNDVTMVTSSANPVNDTFEVALRSTLQWPQMGENGDQVLTVRLRQTASGTTSVYMLLLQGSRTIALFSLQPTTSFEDYSLR